eukprot:2223175-Ditylum_brightwellii.AAC.1
MDEGRLFELLNIGIDSKEDRQRLDANAIIREVQQNPTSAEKEYRFLDDVPLFPLHQAILLKAPIS